MHMHMQLHMNMHTPHHKHAIDKCLRKDLWQEHVSGAGAGPENGSERARKPDERERDLKKYGGAGAELSRSGTLFATSAAKRKEKRRKNIQIYKQSR